MKKKLLVVSLVVNVALLAGLLFARADYEEDLNAYTRTMMNADEQYIGLLNMSLSAIDSSESEDATVTADLLRKFLVTANINSEARRRAGLVR